MYEISSGLSPNRLVRTLWFSSQTGVPVIEFHMIIAISVLAELDQFWGYDNDEFFGP